MLYAVLRVHVLYVELPANCVWEYVKTRSHFHLVSIIGCLLIHSLGSMTLQSRTMCACIVWCMMHCMYVYDVYQVNLNAPHDLHYPLCGACAMFMDLMVSLNPTTHITMYKNLIASFIV